MPVFICAYGRRAQCVLRETFGGEALGWARSFVGWGNGNLNRGVTTRGALEAHEVAVCSARLSRVVAVHRDMIRS